MEIKQREATGVSQQSEGTGVHQQSEATAVNQQSEGTGVNQQSKGCGVSSSSGDARPRIYKSTASVTRVSTQSEGCKAYSNIYSVRGLVINSIEAGVRVNGVMCKRVSGCNGGAGIRQGHTISAAASVQGEHERRTICNGSWTSSSGARERASCHVCGEVDGDSEEKVVEFVCGSGLCKVGSTCSDEHEDSDHLFGRNRMLSFRDKTAGREGSGKCEASFSKYGKSGSSHKSNIATKVRRSTASMAVKLATGKP